MFRPTFLILLVAGAPLAQALTLQGTVAGEADIGAHARLGLWSLSASGNVVGGELVSTPIASGKFSLQLPSTAPVQQYTLRPDSIGWPGVVGDVQVTPSVQASDLAFFIYNDSNDNAVRDSNEPLHDTLPDVQRQPLFVVWASAPSKVVASKGFNLSLNSGWNAFSVELGKTATVNSYNGEAVSLRVQ